jgi:hypothetical protein
MVPSETLFNGTIYWREWFVKLSQIVKDSLFQIKLTKLLYVSYIQRLQQKKIRKWTESEQYPNKLLIIRNKKVIHSLAVFMSEWKYSIKKIELAMNISHCMHVSILYHQIAKRFWQRTKYT